MNPLINLIFAETTNIEGMHGMKLYNDEYESTVMKKNELPCFGERKSTRFSLRKILFR